MIGLEEVTACSAVEGIGSCQERSASEIADATGNHRPLLSSYRELLNQNVISIVGEKEARYGRMGVLMDDGKPLQRGLNRALMIGELITAFDKFKFGEIKWIDDIRISL